MQSQYVYDVQFQVVLHYTKAHQHTEAYFCCD